MFWEGNLHNFSLLFATLVEKVSAQEILQAADTALRKYGLSSLEMFIRP